MYTKGEHDEDLRNALKNVGQLINGFEAVCRHLRYRNNLDTMNEFRKLHEKGLINYPEEEYAKDLCEIFKQLSGIDMSTRLIKKEDQA